MPESTENTTYPHHRETQGLLNNTMPMTTRGFFTAIMLAVFSVIFLAILLKLKSLLVLVFVSVLIATSLAGPVKKMESWGLRKSLAILVMFLGIGAFFGGITWFALPPLVGQIAEAIDSVPDRIDQFSRLQDRYSEFAKEYPVLTDIETQATSAVADFGASVTQMIIEIPGLVMLAIFVLSSLLTLSFLMLMSWPSIQTGILRLVHPDHRQLTHHVLTEVGTRIGAYFRAKFIVVTVVAIWMYVTVALLGSPLAVLISIFAGLCEIIPRIGPLFGRAALVIAVMPLGWQAMVVVFISHMVIDNIKGSWLSPLIEGQQLNIHPLTAFISVLAGTILLGWMGALIAVPVAAAVQVVIEEVVIPWRLRQLEMVESVQLQKSDGQELQTDQPSS